MDTKNIKPEDKKGINKPSLNAEQKKDLEKKVGAKEEKRGGTATAVKPTGKIEENEDVEDVDDEEESGGKGRNCSR